MTSSARPNNWPNEWQDLLAGYALGNLSSEEAEALQQLLSEHPELTAEVDRLQEVLALIPYDVPEHEPPAHLKQSILAAAEADKLPMPLFQDAAPIAKRRLRPGWIGATGAIAAVALLTLGIENYRLRQAVELNRPILAALQQPGTQVYTLEGTENAARAAGSIVIAPGTTPNQRQVLMIAQNLPQLPAGQEYRLWAMPQNSQQPAYCGQFNSSASGTVSTILAAPESTPIACSTPAQLLITAESATAPPIPQGDLVMQSRV